MSGASPRPASVGRTLPPSRRRWSSGRLLATCPLKVCLVCSTPWKSGAGKTFVLGERRPATTDDVTCADTRTVGASCASPAHRSPAVPATEPRDPDWCSIHLWGPARWPRWLSGWAGIGSESKSTPATSTWPGSDSGESHLLLRKRRDSSSVSCGRSFDPNRGSSAAPAPRRYLICIYRFHPPATAVVGGGSTPRDRGTAESQGGCREDHGHPS